MGETTQKAFRTAFKLSKNVLHWYPGHMEKGMAAMQGKLRSVDCVLEVHDARVAISGRNPNFMKKLLGVKPHILVLNKVDLIDSSDIKRIESTVKADGIENIIFTNCLNYRSCKGINGLVPKAIELISKSERYNRSEAQDLCMMIIGIPNVGKSSIINALRKINIGRSSATKVGPEAGVTRSVLTKIKVNVCPTMFLIDTPGILPPNISNDEVALKLALCACFKSNALTDYVIVDYLLYWLNKMGNFQYVYECNLDEPKDNILPVLGRLATDHNYVHKVLDVTTNKYVTRLNLNKACKLMIDKFRKGRFGLINLDKDILIGQS